MSLCPARFESIKGRLLNLFVCLFVFPDRQSVSDACVGLEVKKTWFFEKSSCKVSTLQYLQGGDCMLLLYITLPYILGHAPYLCCWNVEHLKYELRFLNFFLLRITSLPYKHCGMECLEFC